MASLDKFRAVDIRLDKANEYYIETQFAKEGDYNGRDLVVQITNAGEVTSQTGVTLNLGWKHEAVGNKGLDPFEVVDASQGIFKISYPTEMLNAGTVVAVIQVVENTKITLTRNFKITVEKSPIDESAVVSENSFTALTDALIQINKYQSDIDGIKQDLVDESNQLIATEKAELDALQLDYSERASTLEEEYAPRLTEVTAQLQQTKNFQDYEIQNKTRNTQALFTIQDDDGRVEVLSMLEPLRAEFDIPMSAAIIPQWVGGYGFMTKEQIVDLASKGWEIVSHTSNHEKLNEYSYEVQDDTMKRSVDTLRSWGITDVTSIAYPFGRRNDDTVKSARKYFRSGRSTDIGINRPPLQTWDTVALNGEGGDSSLAAIKARIDDIALNGGWGIYVTHAGLDNNVPAANAREVIEYVLAKGNIEIVSYNEALNRMGNIIDNGRYWEKDLTKPHGVVGADGTIRSNEILPQIVTTEDGVTSATPPNAFKLGKQYTTRILYTNRTGFPEDKHGTLVTKLTTATHWNEYVTQEYYPLNSYVAYRRYATSPTEWSAWKDQSYAAKLATKPSFDSPPGFFPQGVSFYPIQYVDRAGWPENASGSLITYRIEGYLWQIYQINGKNTQFIRTQNQVHYGWNTWRRITPHATTSGDMKNMDSTFLNEGDLVYNTSLNKPLWRNSANTGWVDATGTAVVL